MILDRFVNRFGSILLVISYTWAVAALVWTSMHLLALYTGTVVSNHPFFLWFADFPQQAHLLCATYLGGYTLGRIQVWYVDDGGGP